MDSEFYRKVIKKFGTENQIKKAIEELDELKAELEIFLLCGDTNIEQVILEMADVVNMINQLKIIFKVKTPALNAIMETKMVRTMREVSKEDEGIVE